jgi:hypothetical protein
MVAIDVEEGLNAAWERIATFVPKLVGFLLILLIGYVVAMLISKAIDAFLERVGFDRWVERGALKETLAKSRFDASDVLSTIAFWTLFLLVLQLAFGVFGPNPVSDLLTGLIAYLPKVFVAVVIVVIAAAVAKVVTELLQATLGGVSGGTWMARAAGVTILVVGVFAALNVLEIAPAIVNGLFYAMLAIIVGSAIVAIGGGGIQTMRRYWERASVKLESTAADVRDNADPDAARARAAQMAQAVDMPGSDTGAVTERTVDLRDPDAARRV